MEAVLVALLASAVPSFFAYKASRHSQGTRADLATNHGKRPGEYLEQIADLAEGFHQHRIDDARQFAEIKERL